MHHLNTAIAAIVGYSGVVSSLNSLHYVPSFLKLLFEVRLGGGISLWFLVSFLFVSKFFIKAHFIDLLLLPVMSSVISGVLKK